MKNIYFFSKSPIQDGANCSLETLMRRTGGNTGNLVFMRAVERQIRTATLQRGQLKHPKIETENCDALVIPAANWLSPNNQFLGTLADRIESTKLPCVVIGLGAQALAEEQSIKLGKGAKRFLKVISERSHSISVRGDYSAEVAASAGIDNITVTGCPSFFWTLSRKKTLRAPRNGKLTVSVNASRNRRVATDLEDCKHRIERELYQQAFRRQNSFVTVQTETAEASLALNYPVDSIDASELRKFLNFIGTSCPLNDIQRRFRIYSDVDAWLNDLQQVDLVIGTRLHACLLGLAAGIPSILITIDSRTREIAKLFNLPSYEASSTRLYLNLEDLYLSTDFSLMRKKYPRLYDNYRDFLIKNGLQTALRPAPFKMPGRY